MFDLNNILVDSKPVLVVDHDPSTNAIFTVEDHTVCT